MANCRTNYLHRLVPFNAGAVPEPSPRSYTVSNPPSPCLSPVSVGSGTASDLMFGMTASDGCLDSAEYRHSFIHGAFSDTSEDGFASDTSDTSEDGFPSDTAEDGFPSDTAEDGFPSDTAEDGFDSESASQSSSVHSSSDENNNLGDFNSIIQVLNLALEDFLLTIERLRNSGFTTMASFREYSFSFHVL